MRNLRDIILLTLVSSVIGGVFIYLFPPSTLSLFPKSHAAAPTLSDVMPSVEYRACMDKLIVALDGRATFFPQLRGTPKDQYYSTARDEIQLYLHKPCMAEFQTWLVRDCLQLTGETAQACLARDQDIITDEIHDLGRQMIATYYPGALGQGISIRKGQQ